MIDAGEIGEPQMLRMHVSTGKSETAWKVPLSAWVWRFDEGKSGGGPGRSPVRSACYVCTA